MPKMFLIFSHKLTMEQKLEAKSRFKIDTFIYLPKNLQNIWSNIPPDIDNLNSYLVPIKDWLKSNLDSQDYVLVQGDMGATCKIVSFLKENNIKALYSTTKRETKEKLVDNKIEKLSLFKHIKFREF